ncbi:MAG TPA: HAMP domain-containing sensor histidine kinase [Steroidobacteraceae bacterium]|nr:HAMP domain-containing sensor histidine kinase [Steroidobacteraceae bacterium]
MESISGTLDSPASEQEDVRASALLAEVERLKADILSRDNLLAVAAHELRNPMHTLLLLVTATLSIARRERLDALTPKLERMRHVVEMSVKRATLLLDSVRLDSRTWAADRSQFDFCRSIREICASFEPDAQFAGSTMRLDLPAQLLGSWDRLAVEQIIANLVSNAIKYGRGSPIQVSLQAQGMMARLSVRDQGIGISADDQQKIFERFQQAPGSTHKRGGFGIGLWLVRSLVEAQGGSISVQSSPEQGSTFTVLLPGLLSATDSPPPTPRLHDSSNGHS